MNREDVIRDIRERYRQRGRSLNEFQRRHWAAREAMKIGWGGITLVSKALRVSPNTIKRGIQEIAAGHADSPSQANARIRKPGGGRKSKKDSRDRLPRTITNQDSAATEPECRAAEFFDDDRRTPSKIPTELNPLPVDDNASDRA
jgi:hypothetical protein